MLTSSKYIDNGKLIVVVDTDAEYKMTASTIQFVNTVWPAGTEFEIVSFYNHVYLKDFYNKNKKVSYKIYKILEK